MGSAQPPNTNMAGAEDEFAYLPPPKQIDADYYKVEGVKEKLVRKTKQNPFIILGIGVTTYALVLGIYQLKTGDRKLSQSLMRLRLIAQGATVLAVLGGVFYSARKAKMAGELK